MKAQDGDVQRIKLEPDLAITPVVQRVFRECLSRIVLVGGAGTDELVPEGWEVDG